MEIYHEYFLYGNVDFSNDENIIFEKDVRKDQPESENHVKRKRGRPRKNPLPLIQDEGDLMNPNMGSEENNGSESEGNEGAEEESGSSDQ